MGFFFIVKIEMGYCIYMCCICVIFKLKKKNKYVLFYLVFFLDKVGIMLMDWVGGGYMGILGVGGVCCICFWIIEIIISVNLLVNFLEFLNIIRVYILIIFCFVFKIYVILNRVIIMLEIDICFMNDYI